MEHRSVTIRWPGGIVSTAQAGAGWLESARAVGVIIPTGCLGGSCGACEIEVNGEMVRACISTVPPAGKGVVEVELASDPYW